MGTSRQGDGGRKGRQTRDSAGVSPGGVTSVTGSVSGQEVAPQLLSDRRSQKTGRLNSQLWETKAGADHQEGSSGIGKKVRETHLLESQDGA